VQAEAGWGSWALLRREARAEDAAG